MSDSSSDSELEMEAPPAENVLINMKENPAKGKAFKPPSARIIENYEEIDGLEKPKKREMSAAALAKRHRRCVSVLVQHALQGGRRETRFLHL